MNQLDIDDDAPLAVGGAAFGAPSPQKSNHKKAGSLPPWVILFLGGMLIFTLLGVFTMKLLNRGAPKAEYKTVAEERSMPTNGSSKASQETHEPPQQTSAVSATAIAPPIQNANLMPPVNGQVQGTMTSTIAPSTQVASPTAPTASNSDSQNITALQNRVADLEERVDQLTATLTDQSPAMRRIITERAQRQTQNVRSTSQRNVKHKKTATPEPLHQSISGDFSIHAVVGTRAWLRPAGSNEAEVIVTLGDFINGSRIKDVQSKRVLLENGTVIE